MRGVKDALAAGASVNGRRGMPFSPLMMAAGFSDPSMIEFLVERGADLEAGAACDTNYVDGRRMVKSRVRTAVHCAVRYGKVDNLRALFKLGANPNAMDSIGHTPLMLVFLDRVDDGGFRAASALVIELLRAGANIELAAHDGKVALHFATEVGALYDILYRLISLAVLNLSDNNGHSPLYYAALEGHEGTVSRLLAMGASDEIDLILDTHDPGLSSLLTAVGRGRSRVVRTILDEGIEAVGGIGVIPVAIVTAINGRQVRLLQILLADERCQKVLRSYSFEKTATMSDCINALLSHVESDRGNKVAAIRQVLERAPASWARSWAWPTGVGGADTSGATVPAKRSLGVSVVRQPKNDAFFTVRLTR